MLINVIYLYSDNNNIKTNTMTTQEKIKLSFELEFEQTAEVINFNSSNGFVTVGSKSFYCVLNSKGVKKNSWRLEC